MRLPIIPKPALAGDMRVMLKSTGLARVTLASIMAGMAFAASALLLSQTVYVAAYLFLMTGLAPVALAYGIVSSYDADVQARAPELFYDLSEHVRSGGSMVKAVKRVSADHYGVMSDEVCRVLSEIEDEGYDIARSLDAMAGRMCNAYISRSVSVIKEALTSSPDIEGILKMVSDEGRLSLTLDKERRSGILPAVMVIYLTSIIMIFVVSICITSFMPVSQQLSTLYAGDASVFGGTGDLCLPYYALSLSVAVCSGFTVGIMRDNSVYGGFKDASVLVTVAFLMFEVIVLPGFNLMGAFVP